MLFEQLTQLIVPRCFRGHALFQLICVAAFERTSPRWLSLCSLLCNPIATIGACEMAVENG